MMAEKVTLKNNNNGDRNNRFILKTSIITVDRFNRISNNTIVVSQLSHKMCYYPFIYFNVYNY